MPAIQHQREKLLDDFFFIWGTEQGLDLLGMFERHHHHMRVGSVCCRDSFDVGWASLAWRDAGGNSCRPTASFGWRQDFSFWLAFHKGP